MCSKNNLLIHEGRSFSNETGYLIGNLKPLKRQSRLQQTILRVLGLLRHIKRESKPCVYFNTVTNHSYHYSHFRVSRIFILNVKSNVQADPSLQCLYLNASN